MIYSNKISYISSTEFTEISFFFEINTISSLVTLSRIYFEIQTAKQSLLSDVVATCKINTNFIACTFEYAPYR
jgi:hypothetical protein